MGAVKNMIKGFIFTGIYAVFAIVLPLVLFTLIFSIEFLQFEQQDQNNIKFWLVAFGLLVSGLAFFKYSSPKQSIRKAIFALIQVIVNCLYIWSYRPVYSPHCLHKFHEPGHGSIGKQGQRSRTEESCRR